MFVILILSFVSLCILLVNWRWGIYLIILAGFIQDPVRKIIENQPVQYTTSVIFVFAISFIIALIINDSWRLRYLTLGNSKLETSVGIYVAFIIFSSLFTFVTYANPVITIIGISIYLGPFTAAVYASLLFDRHQAIASFLRCYLIGIVLLILTIWLSVFGFDYLIFEEVGGGINIYEHTIRGYLDAHAGIARSSEIAAWHLASGACLSLILALHTKNTLTKVLLCLLSILCLFSGIFTGRRKMYALFVIFCLSMILFLILESHSKHKNFVLFAVVLILTAAVSIFIVFKQQLLFLSFASDYLSRAFTIFGDATDRLSLTADSFTFTLKNIAVVGDGVGTTGQGIAGFGKSAWNSETGLGRLGNELGLLGLLIVMVAGAALIYHILVTNMLLKRYSPQFCFLQRALIAFLFANLINYFNAAQAYNDLFILLLLGLILGILLAMPRIFYHAVADSN